MQGVGVREGDPIAEAFNFAKFMSEVCKNTFSTVVLLIIPVIVHATCVEW